MRICANLGLRKNSVFYPMPYHKISRDLKFCSIRLYERELLNLEDILDCVGFSERTFYRILTESIFSHSQALITILAGLTPRFDSILDSSHFTSKNARTDASGEPVMKLQTWSDDDFHEVQNLIKFIIISQAAPTVKLTENSCNGSSSRQTSGIQFSFSSSLLTHLCGSLHSSSLWITNNRR